VSPPPSPTSSRSNSYGNLLSAGTATESRRGLREGVFEDEKEGSNDIADADSGIGDVAGEETPLLEKEALAPINADSLGQSILTRISSSLLNSIRWVLSTLAAPGVYLIACLYDERGKFAPFSQVRKAFSGGTRRVSTSRALGMSSSSGETPLGGSNNGKPAGGRRSSAKASKALSSSSSSSGMSSESDSDRDQPLTEGEKSTTSLNRHARSKSSQSSDEISPARRSIRIKLSTEDSLRQRKRKGQAASTQSNGAGGISTSEISAASLKSPTSPASSLSMTKYPRAPAPPRPLIPRRQPSYTMPDTPAHTQKTLIIDLDETLIHSMSRGGRMGTGHAVEVNLNTSGVSTAEPHILYYVYKRPYCDEFLRRVSILRCSAVLRLIRLRYASGIT
jgi:CTD nuclear envelope phosphatase 1